MEAAKELLTVLDGHEAAVAVAPSEELPASKRASSMAAKMPGAKKAGTKAPSRKKGGKGNAALKQAGAPKKLSAKNAGASAP